MKRRDGVEADQREAARLIRLVAGNDGTAKARIREATRILGWNHSRTRDIWNRDAHRIDAFEMDALREKSGAVRNRTEKPSETSDSGCA